MISEILIISIFKVDSLPNDPIFTYSTGPPVTQSVIYLIWLNKIQRISSSVTKHYEILLFLKALSSLHSEGVAKSKNLLYNILWAKEPGLWKGITHINSPKTLKTETAKKILTSYLTLLDLIAHFDSSNVLCLWSQIRILLGVQVLRQISSQLKTYWISWQFFIAHSFTLYLG